MSQSLEAFPIRLPILLSRPIDPLYDLLINELSRMFEPVILHSLTEWQAELQANHGRILVTLVDRGVGRVSLADVPVQPDQAPIERLFFPWLRELIGFWDRFIASTPNGPTIVVFTDHALRPFPEQWGEDPVHRRHRLSFEGQSPQELAVQIARLAINRYQASLGLTEQPTYPPVLSATARRELVHQVGLTHERRVFSLLSRRYAEAFAPLDAFEAQLK